jgi:hypothetical protein
MNALLWIVGGAVLVHVLRGWGLVIFVVLLFTLNGCTTMSPEDREYRDQQVREMYTVCRQWYADSGVVWYEERRGSRIKGPSTLDMEMTMRQHDCRRYLKALGYEL